MRNSLTNEPSVWPRKLEQGISSIKEWRDEQKLINTKHPLKCPQRSHTAHPQWTDWFFFFTIHCKWSGLCMCDMKTPYQVLINYSELVLKTPQWGKYRSYGYWGWSLQRSLGDSAVPQHFNSGMLVNSDVRNNTERPHAFLSSFLLWLYLSEASYIAETDIYAVP